MSAAPKHREAVVHAALALFRRKGYAATGLNDIVEESGAPKGSLYHYFPDGKAAIGEAAVREASRRVVETLSALTARTRSAGQLIKAHAELLAGWMEQSGFRDGSPTTTILLETAPADPAITKAGRDSFDAWRAVLSARLVQDGLTPRRAERLATLAIAALDGALVQARVERSGAPILTAAEELDRLIKQDIRARREER